MKMNPFLNAAGAALYIVLIVNVIHTFERFAEQEDTLLAPIIMLSLFVVSATVMGLLFIYKPLTLYIDGQKQESLSFFLKTLGTFALFALVFIGLLFMGLGSSAAL